MARKKINWQTAQNRHEIHYFYYKLHFIYLFVRTIIRESRYFNKIMKQKDSTSCDIVDARKGSFLSARCGLTDSPPFTPWLPPTPFLVSGACANVPRSVPRTYVCWTFNAIYQKTPLSFLQLVISIVFIHILASISSSTHKKIKNRVYFQNFNECSECIYSYYNIISDSQICSGINE